VEQHYRELEHEPEAKDLIMASIVIIDDSEFLVAQMKRYLEKLGHEIVAVGHDGFAGLRLYKKFRPDVLTLDLTMPNKDGRDCLKDLMREEPEAKVLIVSALVDKSILVQCLEMGAKAFIEKPLRFHEDDFCEQFNQTLSVVLNHV
jgi:two-component system chemotaxis response regulator CheY